jgi:hypothetical protein
MSPERTMAREVTRNGDMTENGCVFCIPRFDDEPLADHGGRSAVKVPENRRPDPFRRGNGRARSFGRASSE